ncbi:hypothetical protein H1C71_022004 [Ictidomys tridecemlineatus]|nr:hypothetical protein H1C71_022004 [Ictidomys tridecemlineatus]
MKGPASKIPQNRRSWYKKNHPHLAGPSPSLASPGPPPPPSTAWNGGIAQASDTHLVSSLPWKGKFWKRRWNSMLGPSKAILGPAKRQAAIWSPGLIKSSLTHSTNSESVSFDIGYAQVAIIESMK